MVGLFYKAVSILADEDKIGGCAILRGEPPMQQESCYDIECVLAVTQEQQVSPVWEFRHDLSNRGHPHVIAPCLADNCRRSSSSSTQRGAVFRPVHASRTSEPPNRPDNGRVDPWSRSEGCGGGPPGRCWPADDDDD